MKILILTPSPPQTQPTNAVPLVVHALLAGLIPRHEVTLVTVAGPDLAELQALDSLQKLKIDIRAVRRLEPHGIQRWKRRWRLASAWLGGRYPFRTIWYWEPGIQPLLDRLFAEQSFDLVTVEDNAMAIYRYQTRAPVMLSEMEVRRPRPIHWDSWSGSHCMQWMFSETDWQRWYHYQRAIWRRFDRIQVFTPRDAAAIKKIAPELADCVRINPFGIELSVEVDSHREEPGSIVFIGGFSHQPNVDAALWLGHEIMPLLRVLYPGVRLTIVGSQPPEPVRALACADITVTGRVPKVEPFLAQAAVILAPLRIGGGMRMKVLQGMAFGKAVVTTPIGAEGLTIVGDDPPLVIAEDAAAIANATAQLLAADRERRALGQRAQAFVAKHYSPHAYARRLEEIYAELVRTETTNHA